MTRHMKKTADAGDPQYGWTCAQGAVPPNFDQTVLNTVQEHELPDPELMAEVGVDWELVKGNGALVIVPSEVPETVGAEKVKAKSDK